MFRNGENYISVTPANGGGMLVKIWLHGVLVHRRVYIFYTVRDAIKEARAACGATGKHLIRLEA